MSASHALTKSENAYHACVDPGCDKATQPKVIITDKYIGLT